MSLPSPPVVTNGGAAVSQAAAALGAGDSAEDHSLCFRVMRLARPEFKPTFAAIKCELNGRDGGGLGKDSEIASGGGGTDWASRVQLTHPSKACNLDGSLVLPQNFGTIQLGESFSCYISLGNVSSKAVSNISIRVELQTERQRRNIFENTRKPLETLAPGQRYDFIIQHDVKELGTHTLVCSTVYTEPGAANSAGAGSIHQEQLHFLNPIESGLPSPHASPTPASGSAQATQSGERKYLPQWYKFKVTNPLVVRMKVRTVSNQLKQRTFVEACLENATSDPLLLDLVKFEQSRGYTLLETGASTVGRERSFLEDLGQSRAYLDNLVLLKPKGGSYNFVFGLEKASDEDAKEAGMGGSASIEGGDRAKAQAQEKAGGLGKLEIRWLKPMGDKGRLQTQQIQGVAASTHQNKKNLIEARVIRVERLGSEPNGGGGASSGGGSIHLHSCFSVTLRVANLTSRQMFGVFVVLGLNSVMRNVGPSGMYFQEIPSSVAPNPAGNPTFANSGQSKHVEITFDLIALQVGVHKLGSVLLYDERGKQVTETPCNFSLEIVPRPPKPDHGGIAAAAATAANHARHDTLTIPMARSDTFDASLLDSPSLIPDLL